MHVDDDSLTDDLKATLRAWQERTKGLAVQWGAEIAQLNEELRQARDLIAVQAALIAATTSAPPEPLITAWRGDAGPHGVRLDDGEGEWSIIVRGGREPDPMREALEWRRLGDLGRA